MFTAHAKTLIIDEDEEGLDQFGFGDIGLEEKDFQKTDQIIQLGCPQRQ